MLRVSFLSRNLLANLFDLLKQTGVEPQQGFDKLSHPKRISWQIFVILVVGAAGVLTGILFTAREIHRRGIFVDDTRYWENIQKISRSHGVDPQLVRAVIFQESRFVRESVGAKGEIGLMQLHLKGAVSDWADCHGKKIPSHAALIDVDLNLEIGVWYLARALKRWEKYKEQIPLALVQYNAGASRAVRWKPDTFDGQVIPRIKIDSTKFYVKKIMDRYHKYSGKTQ